MVAPAEIAMPEAPAKPRQETWHDWVPGDSEELTREAFIGRVNAFGADVDEGDLRFWEYQGILPRVVKRWHDGANRAYYPLAAVPIVVLLRELQRTGLPLREIGPILRARAPHAAGMARMVEDERGVPGGADEREWLSFVVTEALLDQLNPALLDHARRYARLSGKAVGFVEVQLLDGGGRPLDVGHTVRVDASEDGGQERDPTR